MKKHARDIILIAIGIGLLVAVFWPVPQIGEPEHTGAETPVAVAPPAPSPAVHDTASIAPDARPAPQATAQAGSPSTPAGAAWPDAPHALFPLVPNLQWTYLVEGAPRLIDARYWHMQVVRVPTEDAPGEMRVGFDDARESVPIYLQEGVLRFAGFPFYVADALRNPVAADSDEETGEAAPELTGALLPEMRQVLPQATWQQVMSRRVHYESQDAHRRSFVEPAQATQTDRAHVVGQMDMVVPAGVFSAWRVEWLGRLDIRAGKRRTVLDASTAAPFRQEVMWWAPGTGLVKRRVKLAAHPGEEVIFSLLRLEVVSGDASQGEQK
ncbi:MAG: hypothetical protein M0R76_08575 [Proteobacteria bacterium]|nr:hypothetical protein [Pseudomonadota bacterium]